MSEILLIGAFFVVATMAFIFGTILSFAVGTMLYYTIRSFKDMVK